MAFVMLVGLCACTGAQDEQNSKFTISLNENKQFELTVGDQVDFTEYFIVTDRNGNRIPVTSGMLDLNAVDLTKPGSFNVTITVDGIRKTASFTVTAADGAGGAGGSGGTGGSGGSGGSTPANFDVSTLQDRLLETDGAIGLPSTGTVRALVVPVQFSGETITQSDLNRLDIAFNGTAEETGWESVNSYYKKSSYGALNLTFDIQPVYRTSKSATYYENYSGTDSEGYSITGDTVLLEEVLAYYDRTLDMHNYDANGDEAIDAVYLIYSHAVDYNSAEFFWAYTTWYYGAEKYDNLDAYYYLFAGFDFMDEKTANDQGSGYDVVPGMKINAETYIHETGHLLGLDDYYDYESNKGSNEGLGGADMMDGNIGDHGVYSKTMLGWLSPTIVTDTQTVTLSSSALAQSALLIPLDSNNSYFCEYLLVDLYTADGLNALHAASPNTYLYDGAPYGVRIYHVSSSADNPYTDDGYSSFTDYDNSVTAHPLIKLIEADGDKKFSKTDGIAARSDLWQTGSKLSDKFPTYKKNNGARIQFDVEMVSVSRTSATITVTKL